ncbi:MAG: hypothetical protein HDR50_03530 [Desulfovibrio sp.]|uniref:hypothetical protein n=1 Tax=Desulfovibrio sp. TaxID=885 RepID=UPI001A76C839|nr:hypothetical protein [Desulfovibrio sp.]MBD5416731.1 hypothetical protein [Desulfovibrio sp.]
MASKPARVFFLWTGLCHTGELVVRLCCTGDAEIIRQKQPFHCWLRQRKISSVEYLSTLPSEIFIFLASSEKSYFLGFFRHQHPSSAALQTELRNILSTAWYSIPFAFPAP